MGYNPRNDEIPDNVTRMRREWEAQRGSRNCTHELESRLFQNLYCCFGLFGGLCWLRFLFRYSSASTVSSEASGLHSSAQSQPGTQQSFQLPLHLRRSNPLRSVLPKYLGIAFGPVLAVLLLGFVVAWVMARFKRRRLLPSSQACGVDEAANRQYCRKLRGGRAHKAGKVRVPAAIRSGG
jgi:hypothetical protein